MQVMVRDWELPLRQQMSGEVAPHILIVFWLCPRMA